jgi:asparagine synthase (glutamine-hydrolysing)
VLAHLSGGLDSSLIVCAASELRKRPGGSDFRFGTVSERFPGTSTDEGGFMDSVTASTAFERFDWDGGTGEFLDMTSPGLAGPTSRVYRSSGSTGDLVIASRRNARVMLAGQGGDQIGTPTGVTDDIATRSPIQFTVETVARRDLAGVDKVNRLRRLAKHYLPLRVRKAVARRRYRRALPGWLEPAWAGVADDIVSTFYPDEVERSFEHHVQRTHWHELTSGRMGTALALQQRVGARFGVEFRFPFLDQDLVDFVLSIPPELWPAPSVGSRLHREAMGDLLPPSVRERRDKAIFSEPVGAMLKRAGPQLIALFHTGDWASRKYVRRPEAQRLLGRALGGVGGRDRWRDWHEVRAIASLEAWLRAVFGYISGPGERGRG